MQAGGAARAERRRGQCRGAAGYLLPPDAIAERWTGTRIKPQEAESVSGVKDVRFVGALETDFSALANSGNYGAVYLDLYRISPPTLTARRTAGET